MHPLYVMIGLIIPHDLEVFALKRFDLALSERVLLFDGSMGALLNLLGYASDCPDLLTLTKPDVIRSIHKSYAQAGADVLITDTLGCTSIALRQHHLEDRLSEIISAAVALAREASMGRCYVALDLGPTGQFLQPAGTLSFEDAYSSYYESARLGAQAGADLILLETHTDIAECRAACLAAREAGLPVAASFTFSPNGSTLTGGSAFCAALTLRAVGACAMGVNCSGGPTQMLAPLAEMRAASPLPVIIQPNAGLPEIVDGRAHFPYSAQDMLPHMRKILASGAAAIGGCCGTTPEHIQAFASLLPEYPHAPAPAWDGIERLCSPRNHVALADARAALREVSDLDELYDLEPQDACALIDLRGLSPEEVRDRLDEAQLITKAPLAFRADSPETLEAALRIYPGVAGYDAPIGCQAIARRYGALAL